jgi:hypothetical protein
MSRFDQYNDTPFQIQNIGPEIAIKLTRSSQSGTITWNIPHSVAGCDVMSVYRGILITIDTEPTDSSKQPIDATQYSADPTADTSIHMGDKIGTALVVAIEDATTNSVIITGLDDSKIYYVSGHAFDNVFQYHTTGTHSYSLPYSATKKPDTAAFQLIQLGTDDNGVLPTDNTGCLPNKQYSVKAILDYDKEHTFEFAGANILTYQALVDEWNYQAALLNNPLISSTIPNIGHYWYQSDTQQLAVWDGDSYNAVAVLVQPDAPNIQSIGDGWVNSVTKVLSIWSGTAWVANSFFINDHKPNTLECDDFWYNSTDWFMWTGTAWISVNGFNQVTDPAGKPTLQCSSYWFDTTSNTLYAWDDCTNKWTIKLAQLSDTNPATPANGHLWFNEIDNTLFKYNGTAYVAVTVKISTAVETAATIPNGTYWYNPSTMVLKSSNGTTLTSVDFLLWMYNPTSQRGGALWWNSSDDTMHEWDSSISNWKMVDFFVIGEIDPSLPAVLEENSIWTTDAKTFKRWDGSEWVNCYVSVTSSDPSTLTTGYWFNTVDKKYYKLTGSVWSEVRITYLATNPLVQTSGDFWYDSDNNILYQFDGTSYVVVPFGIRSIKPNKGFTYFNSTLNKLRMWNGIGWVDGIAPIKVSFSNLNRFIRLETALTGSNARIEVSYSEPTSSRYPSLHSPDPFFYQMTPPAIPLVPVRGGDGLQELPSYMQTGPGLGSDGSPDERRELIDSMRAQLGYPVVEVELTLQQWDTAVQNSLEIFRQRSGSGYRQGFKFLKLEPGVSQYQLTDKRIGYNSIVNIHKIHRVSSAGLSQSFSGGFAGQGQMVLQQLYSAGSYDLISHHLISSYIETMEMMFATAIMFNWNEDDRTLSIYDFVHQPEMVLLEVSVERSEQVLMKDRYTKTWIQGMALVEARYMLAEIRGKFASLPGAGGGVSLNASQLMATADAEQADLFAQLDDYIANNPEEFGGSVVVG